MEFLTVGLDVCLLFLRMSGVFDSNKSLGVCFLLERSVFMRVVLTVDSSSPVGMSRVKTQEQPSD